MRNEFWRSGKPLAVCGTAVALTLGATALSGASADEADAKNLFKAMSDYMAAQKAISFDYDTSFEVVTKDKQKVALASSGTVDLQRPDKIRATRKGGFADVEVVFDGKTLTVFGKNADAYGQSEAPGTIDQLVDTMRVKFQRPMPAADLLLSNINDALMPMVTDAKDLGSGVIGGVECDHLAFRTEEVDWQIWIAQGDQPRPCRYVITSRLVPEQPEYMINFSNWKTGSEVAASDFTFTPPGNAKKQELTELPDTDELPQMMMPKG